MPRPFLRPTAKDKEHLLRTSSPEQAQVLTPDAVAARLRKPRSAAYVKRCSQLDVDGKTWSLERMNQVLQLFDEEFSDVPKESHPVGIVAACDLDGSYEVHVLDIQMETIVHYKKGKTLPAGMERARGLALHPSYAFVEVYTDHLRVIEKNGEVSVIEEE